MDVGEVIVDEEGNATGSGLAFKIFTEILAEIGEDPKKAVAARVGPFCEGLATAIAAYECTLPSVTYGPVAMTGGASLATIATYTPDLSTSASARIGIQVEIWESASLTTGGHAVGEFSLVSSGSALSTSRTDFADVLGLPTSADVAVAVDGLSLLIQAKPSANACKAYVKVWAQPEYQRT
jgi:hypothetical protein